VLFSANGRDTKGARHIFASGDELRLARLSMNSLRKAENLKHQKTFEQLAARTLAQASEAFPFLRDFGPHEILQAECLEVTPDNCRMAEATLSWLHDEGFLRCLGSSRKPDPAAGAAYLEFRNSRLTVVGLNALNQTIDVSGGRLLLAISW